MATVINNPGNDNGSGVGTIIGVIIAIVLLFIIVRWGIPALRGGSAETTNVNVELPNPDVSGN